MKRNAIATALGTLCLMLLTEHHSLGQIYSGSSPGTITGTGTGIIITGTGTTIQSSLSGASLSVSGSATIGGLTLLKGGVSVSGTADFCTNSLLFGLWATDSSAPGLSMVYYDGVSGTNATLTQTVTRPTTSWIWQRLLNSGSASVIMQIDSSNRLIVTGTAATNPSQVVIDPNGALKLSGAGLIVTGTMDSSNTIVASGTSQLLLIPQQGDLLMGTYTVGVKPQ